MASTAPPIDMEPRPGALTPTVGQERFDFLDILRGFALIGIICANMILYSLYLEVPQEITTAMKTYHIDRVVDFLELVFIEGKFYTIFSILFGIGFSILLTRMTAKGVRFHGFFVKRMFFLYLFGVAHAVLFWHDDILQFYAFCGVLLLFFLRASDRTVLLFSLLALLAPLGIKVFGALPPDSFVAPRDFLFERFGLKHEMRFEIWKNGTFTQIVLLNLSSWFDQLDYLITSGMLFRIFSCFLLGFFIGRNEIYKKLDIHHRVIKRITIAGLVIGIPLNFIYAFTFGSYSWLNAAVTTIAILPLSAGYVGLLALAYLNPRWSRRLQIFAPVGRMALTNYIGQSVICTLIFYGTGLGLAGTMGPALYMPLAIIVYFLQVAASKAWFAHFRFGPLEWLWRTLTYGKWIPLRGSIVPV